MQVWTVAERGEYAADTCVWAMNITCRTSPAFRWRAAFGLDLEPMATHASLYLAAVMDWFSRKVLAGRLPITLSADFCVEALQEALGRPGRPEVFNTDQGSQFTSIDCIKALKGEPRRPPPVQGP